MAAGRPRRSARCRRAGSPPSRSGGRGVGAAVVRTVHVEVALGAERGLAPSWRRWATRCVADQPQVLDPSAPPRCGGSTPTLNGDCTPSSSRPTRPAVRRRHVAVEPLEAGGVELAAHAGPCRRAGPRTRRAPGSRPATRARRPAQPSAVEPPGERVGRRGASARRGRRGRRRPAGRASAVSRSWRAALPMRTGGFDQIAAKRCRPARRRAATTRTLARPAAAGVGRDRARARSFTSTAHTVARRRPGGERQGDRPVAAAQVEQVAGSPAAAGASSSSSLVPGSTRSAENTPRSAEQRRGAGRASSRARPCDRASTATVGIAARSSGSGPDTLRLVAARPPRRR